MSKSGEIGPPMPPQPYPGLRPFTGEEWPVFFGREAATKDLARRLTSNGLVAVLGDSGCGKSSLVAAGVIPFVAADMARSGGRLRTVAMQTGPDLLTALTRALAGVDGKVLSARIKGIRPLLDLGADAPAALAEHFGCDDDNRVCILFDPFEEMLDHPGADPVIELLINLAKARPKGLHAILTMRAGALGRCARRPGFAEALNGGQYLVPRMDRAALRRAISEPAALFGGTVERELADRLIAETDGNQDQLSLIQHALALMWRAKPPDKAKLAPDLRFRRVGGPAEQFSAHADAIMAEAMHAPAEEAFVEALFRALAGTGPEGAPLLRSRRFSDLVAITGAPRDTLARIVDRFRATDATLLRPHGDHALADDDEIAITSETVLRNWSRIAAHGIGWRDREENDGLIWTALRNAALEYEADRRARHPPSAVAGHAAWLAGRNAAWAAEHGGGWEAVSSMVTASARRARRLRRRRRLVLFGALGAASLFATLFALTAWQARDATRAARESGAALVQAERQRDAALGEIAAAQVEQSRHLALLAERETRAGRPDLALGLALIGLPEEPGAGRPDRPVIADAVTALTDALWTDRRLAVLGPAAGAMGAAAFSPDGGRMAAASDDGSGWLWDPATGALVARLDGHDGRLNAIAFQPGGTRLLTASADRTARLWNAADGAPGAVLEGHQQGVLAAAFSPDGTSAATGSQDGTTRLWDAATGAAGPVLRGHRDWVWSVAFSGDGALVATASLDGTARLWDAATGTLAAALEGHRGEVFLAVFSPDGTRVATASADGTARLWDAASGTAAAVLEGHDAEVLAIAYSPDGAQVATASADGSVRLWDAATGAPVAVMRGHEGAVFSVAFSGDGGRLVTASADRTARLWDAGGGPARAVLARHRGGVAAAAFSPDGTRVLTASADGTAQLVDASLDAAAAAMAGHAQRVRAASFSPDGTMVATASDDGTARLWNASDGAPGTTLEGHDAGIWSAAFSPDGRRLATASEDGTARLWDVRGRSDAAVLAGHAGPVRAAAFSPDGTRLATASADRTARLWDVRDGSERATLAGHEGPVNAAVFSPDGALVATASADATARLWDAATGNALAVLHGHAQGVWTVAFSPDGARVATASEDGTVRLWETAGGTQVAVLRDHDGPVLAASFSPDGSRLATVSADGTARLWQGTGGAPVAVLRGHGHWVMAAAFSADGTQVATASADGTVRLWDAATGAGTGVLEGHAGPVRSVAFSPDGARLATASDDGTARLWLQPGDLPHAVAQARAGQFRLLTEREKLERDLAPDTGTAPPPAAPEAGACDLLASHPLDPDARAPGIGLGSIDATAAIDACEAAVAQSPDDARLRYLLGRAFMASGHDDEAMQAYQAAADGGYAFAQFELAGLHRAGEEAQEALALYGAALERGVTLAGGPLGDMHWNGEGTAANRTRALEIWRAAATAGDPYSHGNLAWVAEAGRDGTPADPALALRHYAVAVRLFEQAGLGQADAAAPRYRRAALARLLEPDVVVREWLEARAFEPAD